MARSLHAPVGKTNSAIVANAPLASIGLLFTAVLFEISGALMMCAGAPSLAVLHAFAAFIVLAIVGSAHQLLPVLFGSPPVPLPATVAVSAGFVVGFVLLILGFFGFSTFAWAIAALLPAAIAWVATLCRGLIFARTERATAALAGVSTAAFLAATCCAAYMLFSLANGNGFPDTLARTHGSLMVLVFIATFIVALSYRFVPMFALAHNTGYGRRLWQYVLLLAYVGAAAGLFARVAFGLAALALVVLGAQHLKTIQARIRKQVDVSLRYAAVGWCFAIAATTGLAVEGESARIVPAVLVLGLLGWITLTIFGYSMKIVGFLSWQFAKNKDERRKLTPLSSAVPPMLNRVTLAILAVGVMGCAVGFAILPALATPAAYVFLLGSLLYGVLIVRICTPYIRVVEAV